MADSTATHIAQCRTLIDNPENLSESERLNKLFELEWDYQMTENPIMGTYYGFPGHNDRWPPVAA